jgi:hypothetical protein
MNPNLKLQLRHLLYSTEAIYCHFIGSFVIAFITVCVPLPSPASPLSRHPTPSTRTRPFACCVFKRVQQIYIHLNIVCVCVRALRPVSPFSLWPCRTNLSPQLHEFRFIKLSHRTTFYVVQHTCLVVQLHLKRCSHDWCVRQVHQ